MDGSAMEALLEEHAKFEKRGNLGKTIDDIQKTIDILENARDALGSSPNPSPKVLEKLQKPIKQSHDKVNSDLKEIYNALNTYGKALDKRFKGNPLPSEDNDALAAHPDLVNQAIAMHLLREGQFAVAATFMDEIAASPPAPQPTLSMLDPFDIEIEEQRQKPADETFNPKELEQQFGDMYHILRGLRQDRNLGPAIEWARKHRAILEARGSNLEFELCRLQYICLFVGEDFNGGSSGHTTGPLEAWAYAKREFAPFLRRYSRQLQQLMGALAFHNNLQESPYHDTFYNNTAWEEVATSFTREFCSLIGLSADSPLYIATTAGALALPRLLKLQNIMKEKRTEWTTEAELPVETPLPPSYHFHSIFVCPVSKEQATDQNPPMMMPCGHVIARESLARISKGTKFKCPYCPEESTQKDAREVFL